MNRILSGRGRAALLGVGVAVTAAALGLAVPAVMNAHDGTAHSTTARTATADTTTARTATQRASAAATTHHSNRTTPVYLALGDSVSFGYREPANLPTPDYLLAPSFVGFPEVVAADFGWHAVNLSCPGETSASLINQHARSYDCESNAAGTGPGYRTAFPLHVHYTGSQLAAAVAYLRTHHDVRLVSLMIGANDGFLCQATTADHCASELPSVLSKITKNVRTILQAVRAHYHGEIVIVNYYSTDAASATSNATSTALNKAMDAGAAPFGVRIADGYATFAHAAEQAKGDTCTAGLLTTLTTGGCGVHPSVAGQQLLAGAVERATH